MVIEYISSLVGWVLWGWVGFMGFGVIIKMIGSGFKATHSTSMFAVCGIFGLLLIQTLSIEVPFKVLFGLWYFSLKTLKHSNNLQKIARKFIPREFFWAFGVPCSPEILKALPSTVSERYASTRTLSLVIFSRLQCGLNIRNNWINF